MILPILCGAGNPHQNTNAAENARAEGAANHSRRNN